MARRLVRNLSSIVATALAVGSSVLVLAQNPDAPAEFEVAAIRPHAGPLPRLMDLSISGTRVRMEGYSAFNLIMEADRLKNFQISLAAIPHQEGDIQQVMYDIDARVSGQRAPTRDDVRKMLRTLLAERFKLITHRESKTIPVYTLVAGKSVLKLRENAGDDECSVQVQVARDNRNYEEKFSGCGIGELVTQLENLVGGRPVVDKTELTGKYDFRLVASRESRIQPEPGDIDVFSAVRELGLRLESQKAPIEVVVIDQIMKPSEN